MEKYERLRQARQKAGFTSAADAARRLGVPYGTYSGHENGGRGIKDEELVRYARAFGVPSEWLRTGLIAGTGDRIVHTCVGEAGTLPDGEIKVYSDADPENGVMLPSFPATATSAIFVTGSLLRGIADNGSIIQYISKSYSDFSEYIGVLSICFAENQKIYVGSISRGKDQDHFDILGPMLAQLRDVRLEGVSPVISIYTPYAARLLYDERQKIMQRKAPLQLYRMTAE